MPHIIVEYTDTLDFDVPDLLNDLFVSLSGQDTVIAEAVKVRALPVKHCVVGVPTTPNMFTHITLKLLPGRSDELKKAMAQGLADTARIHVANDDVTITAEVIDLHAASYIKE